MKVLRCILFGPFIAVFLGVFATPAPAQEKVRLAHSALESSNSVWYVAKDRGLYKKNGLDADLLFIPSTTTSVSSLVAVAAQGANAPHAGASRAVAVVAHL